MHYNHYIRLLIENIPYFLLAALILTIFLYILLRIVFCKKKPLAQYLWFFCFLFYLQVLYLTTLAHGSATQVTRLKPNFIPFIDILRVYDMGLPKMMLQIVINLLLLAPLGFLLPVQFRKFQSFPRTVLTVMVVSLLIEARQYFIGRSADIDDVIINTVGGIFGYLCFMLLAKITKWLQSLGGRGKGKTKT